MTRAEKPALHVRVSGWRRSTAGAAARVVSVALRSQRLRGRSQLWHAGGACLRRGHQSKSTELLDVRFGTINT